MKTYDLGQALPPPRPSPESFERLSHRRSAPAQALISPGPDREQVEQILQVGARSPDHGKLTPWRFVVLGRETRLAAAERLAAMATIKGLPPKAQAVLAKLTAAPVTILVVSHARPGSKPVWEQQLSAAAVCMNIEHAADALGFSASWITDWYSYDAEAAALFGVEAGETIAGFIHIGTSAEPLLERERPDVPALTIWLP